MIRNFKLKEVLYHGTKIENEFRYIDLNKGRGYKDFGKGFYLAYSESQSIGMAKREGKNKKNRGRLVSNKTVDGVVYAYRVDNSILKKLKVKVFDTANIEWVDFILKCRQSKYTPHDYDIVVGPTADDDTSICINSFLEGAYGNPNSMTSKYVLLRNLEIQNLGIQVFIGTEEGLKVIDQINRKEKYV